MGIYIDLNDSYVYINQLLYCNIIILKNSLFNNKKNIYFFYINCK